MLHPGAVQNVVFFSLAVLRGRPSVRRSLLAGVCVAGEGWALTVAFWESMFSPRSPASLLDGRGWVHVHAPSHLVPLTVSSLIRDKQFIFVKYL